MIKFKLLVPRMHNNVLAEMMNVAPKRTHNLPKSNPSSTRYNGKLKEILSSTSSASSSSSFPSPSSSSSSSTASSTSSSPSQLQMEIKILDSDFTNIPLIKQCDNSRLLPKYTASKYK